MKLSTKNKLAEAHWKYVESVLNDEIPDDISYSKREYIEGAGRHYRAALIHGIKHGMEDKNDS